jgi:hypothetical protein
MPAGNIEIFDLVLLGGGPVLIMLVSIIDSFVVQGRCFLYQCLSQSSAGLNGLVKLRLTLSPTSAC